jgi:hypothetical protein
MGLMSMTQLEQLRYGTKCSNTQKVQGFKVHSVHKVGMP